MGEVEITISLVCLMFPLELLTWPEAQQQREAKKLQHCIILNASAELSIALGKWFGL